MWATFPAVYLRDNCASAVHPTTGQRTVPVWELPPDISIVTAAWAHEQAADTGGGSAAGTTTTTITTGDRDEASSGTGTSLCER